MTLAELKDKADPILADFWAELEKKQEDYFKKHGKYFQLLITPTSPVTDGVDSTFSKTAPSDEKYAADVGFTWATKIPFQVEVHEWVGPDTVGFQSIARANVDKTNFIRQHDNNGKDSGWFIKPTPTS